MRFRRGLWRRGESFSVRSGHLGPTERQMALLKFKQLGAEYNAKRHLLTPEQRAYWETTMANLQRRLGA